jgi:hypothetical protein
MDVSTTGLTLIDTTGIANIKQRRIKSFPARVAEKKKWD